MSQSGNNITVNSGNMTATAFFESSDIRFKNVLETNPNILLNVNVIKYTFIDDEQGKIRYGYSAQQVKEILPELVDGEERLTLNYSDVHTLKIAYLENKIKELEEKINKLSMS
jgi:hypothetical protein